MNSLKNKEQCSKIWTFVVLTRTSLLQDLHHYPRQPNYSPQSASAKKNKDHWTQWLQTRCPDLCGDEVIWAPCAASPQSHRWPSPGPLAVRLQSQQVCRRCSKHGPSLHPPAPGLHRNLRQDPVCGALPSTPSFRHCYTTSSSSWVCLTPPVHQQLHLQSPVRQTP